MTLETDDGILVYCVRIVLNKRFMIYARMADDFVDIIFYHLPPPFFFYCWLFDLNTILLTSTRPYLMNICGLYLLNEIYSVVIREYH